MASGAQRAQLTDSAIWYIHTFRVCCFQAQRLAALERLVKKLTQQLAGGAAHNPQGIPGGAKDRPDERLLRRLGRVYLGGVHNELKAGKQIKAQQTRQPMP